MIITISNTLYLKSYNLKKVSVLIMSLLVSLAGSQYLRKSSERARGSGRRHLH